MNYLQVLFNCLVIKPDSVKFTNTVLFLLNGTYLSLNVSINIMLDFNSLLLKFYMCVWKKQINFMDVMLIFKYFKSSKVCLFCHFYVIRFHNRNLTNCTKNKISSLHFFFRVSETRICIME